MNTETQTVVRVVPACQRRPLPAWFLSVLLHATIFLLLAWTLRFAPRGAALEPDRQAGIVLVHAGSTDERRYQGAPETAASAAPEMSLQEALPDVDQLPVQLPGAEMLPDGGRPAVSIATAGDGSLPGAGPGGLGGPQGSTRVSVFGVTGEGSKFVFVFDRSGSMDGYAGRPLAAAKAELIRSLQALDSIHQFQIIFYNETPAIFRPDGSSPRLIWGDEQGKQLAERFVRGITAGGGTRHLEALKMALAMHPDVIFFLTDADEPRLTVSELAQVRRLNRGTVIHAIEFGLGNPSHSENFLVQLARQNAGHHAYVDISRLPLP